MKKTNTYKLYPGIELAFCEYNLQESSCRHKPEHEIIEINYCQSGRIGWKTQDGSTVYLGSGDFTIHTKGVCSGSDITFPNGSYSGLSIYVDLKNCNRNLTELLAETPVTGEDIYKKFCTERDFITFPGSETTKGIFDGFFGIPHELKNAYYKLKLQELFLYLYRLDLKSVRETNGFRPDQIEMIKQIHDRLTENLDRRITIEELSRQFPINPSTMKILFKSVYGNSIAAHIKEHRMEKAAMLLRSGVSISEAAKSVGYDSQSKFSSEFKKTYQMLPTEYKRTHKRNGEG